MQRWPWLLLAMALFQPLPVWSQDVIKPDPLWKVARAQFTTQIDNREPVDQVVLVRPPVNELYFFTDLRHLEGRKVTHRWEFQGQLISLVPFEVAGPRWRVFSKKEIEPEQIGEWSVTVLDESGWPLHTEIFHYEAAVGSAEESPATTIGAPDMPVEVSPLEEPVTEVPVTEVPVTEVPVTEVPAAVAPAVDPPPVSPETLPGTDDRPVTDQPGSEPAASE